MKTPSEYPFARYLSAKKSIDDRALNKNVWQSLTRALSAESGPEPVRVLEIGAGIGTMVERAVEWGLIDTAEYLAIDSLPENMSEAATRIPAWATNRGYTVVDLDPRTTLISTDARRFRVRFEATDVFDFIGSDAAASPWDLLVANAFLDLVDVPRALPKLFSLIRPGGLFYFSVTFDGCTIFQPEIDRDLDARIEALYHETMDRRIVNGSISGDSRTGRHFFHHAMTAGAEILDAGASDWVVFPGPDGYPADEAFFLHFIIHTVGTALRGHPDLDASAFDQWIDLRHAQVEQGTLVYIAHQMDFLGRVG
jgi:SAM-dependent methyltransferase